MLPCLHTTQICEHVRKCQHRAKVLKITFCTSVRKVVTCFNCLPGSIFRMHCTRLLCNVACHGTSSCRAPLPALLEQLSPLCPVVWPTVGVFVHRVWWRLQVLFPLKGSWDNNTWKSSVNNSDLWMAGNIWSLETINGQQSMVIERILATYIYYVFRPSLFDTTVFSSGFLSLGQWS